MVERKAFTPPNRQRAEGSQLARSRLRYAGNENRGRAHWFSYTNSDKNRGLVIGCEPARLCMALVRSDQPVESRMVTQPTIRLWLERSVSRALPHLETLADTPVTTAAGFSRVANRDRNTLRVSFFPNSICC